MNANGIFKWRSGGGAGTKEKEIRSNLFCWKHTPAGDGSCSTVEPMTIVNEFYKGNTETDQNCRSCIIVLVRHIAGRMVEEADRKCALCKHVCCRILAKLENGESESKSRYLFNR